MQTDNINQMIKSYTIPLDLLLDILKILLSNNISYHIESINENESNLLMQLRFNPSITNNKKAKENIESFLTDYEYFLHCSVED